MVKTQLYLVRHGKTMFNSIRRAQGWSDSPLTETGRAGIRGLGRGLREQGIDFVAAYSSDSGRTIETLNLILEQQGQTDLPRQQDPRIREWCFGSFEGHHDEELFMGLIPRVLDLEEGQSFSDLSYEEIAQGLLEVDTAGWAQPWEVLKDRLLSGFGDIAESIAQAGGGKGLVVSHGMSISTFLSLIDPSLERQHIQNGSVSLVTYEAGRFTIEKVGDTSYRDLGKELLEHETE